MDLRPYQQLEIVKALEWLQASPLGSRRIAAAPTGTGKGLIQVTLLRLLNRSGVKCALLSPSVEIIKGLMRHFPDCDPDKVEIFTPVKFMNSNPTDYQCLIVDECHEWIPDNVIPSKLERLLPGCRWLGYTATPYRGTYTGTYALQQYWGPINEIINLRQAAGNGYFSMPQFEIVPLVDDDDIPTQGEEFINRDLNEFCLQQNRLESTAKLIDQLYSSGSTIVVSVASRLMGDALEAKCKAPCTYIGQDTPRRRRDEIYEQSRINRLPILQLGVLYRGVDLPWLDTLVDAQPTLSATRWMQTIGRITRPYQNRDKLVVCTNRNFERHGWLLSGEITKAKFLELSTTFPTKSERVHKDLSRWLGFEKARKSWSLVAKDGTEYLWYRFLYSESEKQMIHLGLIAQPSNRTCLWAKRTMTAYAGGWRYSPWVSCPPPSEGVKGLRSADDKPPSPKQIRLWESMQRSLGIVGTPTSGEQITALSAINDLRKGRRA